MAYNDKLKMDADALKTIAADVDDTQLATQSLVRYVGESSFKATDFGKTQFAEAAGGALKAAVDGLTASYRKVDAYLGKSAAALRTTAGAQTLNEEDGKWGFDKLNRSM
jgi:predicted component of type VI protein secretion system